MTTAKTFEEWARDKLDKSALAQECFACGMAASAFVRCGGGKAIGATREDYQKYLSDLATNDGDDVLDIESLQD
jgi:hypothetical protein